MEHEFHQWLKLQPLPERTKQEILVGIGDDAAIIRPSDKTTVISTDTIADGTHFDLSLHSLELVGRKSLAVNLSDLAAMASEPVAAVLTFMLPKSFGFDEAKQLYRGVAKIADAFDVSIIGGDTNKWDGPLVIGATVIGRRSLDQTGWSLGGAQAGDAIVVSGSFGGSIHGRHLSFTPRIELALYLAQHYPISAATDVSDSLSLDLNALAKASGLGVDFASEAIPISPDVKELEREVALHHALTDGEDFELILAVPKTEVGRLMADENVPGELTVLGATTDEHQELQTLDANGDSVTYKPKGYIH